MRNAVRMNVRTNLLLPEAVVEGIDRLAGPRGRSRYVAEVLEGHIRREERMAALRAAAGIWKDHPEFPTDASVVGWVRKLRSEDRDPWSDDASR